MEMTSRYLNDKRKGKIIIWVFVAKWIEMGDLEKDGVKRWLEGIIKKRGEN